jgi:hypothetical protein
LNGTSLKGEIMPRESAIVHKIKARLVENREKLADCENELDRRKKLAEGAQADVVDCTYRHLWLLRSIADDEALLGGAPTPKAPRAQKAKPQNIEQQLDSGPMTGGE